MKIIWKWKQLYESEETKAKFFTFTPKGLKTKTYLLKGLSVDILKEEVYKELCKFNNDNIQFTKVSQFQFPTKRSKEEGYKLPIILVQLAPNSNINRIWIVIWIESLLYRCIKWEQVRKLDVQ